MKSCVLDQDKVNELSDFMVEGLTQAIRDRKKTIELQYTYDDVAIIITHDLFGDGFHMSVVGFIPVNEVDDIAPHIRAAFTLAYNNISHLISTQH